MKKVSIIFFSFFLLFQSTGNTYNSDPELFIKELVEDAISKLSDKNINDEEKAEFIGKIALENVDIEALSLYTLGEIRKSTEKSWGNKEISSISSKDLNNISLSTSMRLFKTSSPAGIPAAE